MFLKNFPNMDQKTTTLADGTLDPNHDFDCVPTSIADCLSWYTGRPFSGGAIKEAVYGRNYVGGTIAAMYINYCAAQNVRLFNVQGDGPTLVKAVRENLAKGMPTLITEPDPYVAASLGWSHVLVAYAADEDAPGTITMRDPYGMHDAVHTDATWASLFEFGEVWPLAPIVQPTQEKPIIMTTLDRLKAAGWHDDPAADKLTAPNGLFMTKGFRQAVISAQYYDQADWPLELEHGADQMEVSNPAIEPGTQQVCRMTTFEWTTKRGVFRMWTGQEILALRKLVQQHETNPTLPVAVYHDLTDATSLVEGAVADLKDAINRHA